MGYFKHETAIVESNSVGEDTKIWHFAHVREGAIIGNECVIGKGVYIDKDVIIGNRVKIQNFVSIYKGVKIEEKVLIGPSVTFTNDLYPRSSRWSDEKIVSTVVSKGVSIGANSTILCGIKIGSYAMIGAGSVVTKDVPPFGLFFGNPASLKGYVCYCGKKVNDIVEKNDKKILYKCNECGEKIQIEKEMIII